MADFGVAWKGQYPNCEPVGYLMRQAGAPNWLRFHSLPHSKRYPETDQERETLLARQNELAIEVLGSGEPCWLAQTCWQSSGKGELQDSLGARREHALSFAFRFTDDPGSDEVVVSVYAAQTSWTKGRFDKLLLAIADERGRALWMSASTGSVFAPYDGGVDLFLPNPSAVEDLAAKHAAWLPSHLEGL